MMCCRLEPTGAVRKKKNPGVCVCVSALFPVCFRPSSTQQQFMTPFVCQRIVYVSMMRVVSGGMYIYTVLLGEEVPVAAPPMICDSVHIRRALPQHKWKCFSNLYIFRGRNQSACVR